MGPLLVLMSIFANPAASAKVLSWFDGLTVSFVQYAKSRSVLKSVANIRDTRKDAIVKNVKSHLMTRLEQFCITSMLDWGSG